MKKFKKLCCLVLALCMCCNLTLMAYAKDEPKEDPTEETGEAGEKQAPEKAMWNVLIYLCGSDLESKGGLATVNLEMIAKTIPDGNVNVLIQTGGSSEWKAKEKVGIDIAADRLQRWSYSDEGFILEDELENASMAKPGTLSDFIAWSDENFPAEKNLLVLWDHGGGSSTGLIVDENHDSAIMSLDGLEYALKEGKVHFDLIMTDTCLMASIETAQAVSPYADYLLASEEILPGMGSNYEEWLQQLYDEPECGPVRLGKNICNSTQLMYAEKSDDTELKGLTFSVIDLSKINDVAEAFNDYLKEVIALISDPAAFGGYLDAVSTADRYAAVEMTDLYDLARRGSKGGISKEAVLKLENAVDDAVVACVRGSYHPYSHGLSAYLALDSNTGKLDRLARTCQNPWQLAFLDAVNLRWDAPEWVNEITGEIPQLKPELYTVNFETETAEDLSRQFIHIYSGIESGGNIRYELQQYDKQRDIWYTLGKSEDVELIDRKDDDITLAANFTGKWPAIDGQFLQISPKDIQSNTVLMETPVYLPEWERDMELRILASYPESLDERDEDTQEETDKADTEDEDGKNDEEDNEKSKAEHIVEYQLVGIWDGYEASTGLPDRNTYSLSELEGVGIQIAKPVYSGYLDRIGDYRYYEPIMGGTWLEVQDTVLPPGLYRLRYLITDKMDRTSTSEFVNLIWDGTEAVFEAPIMEEDTEETE